MEWLLEKIKTWIEVYETRESVRSLGAQRSSKWSGVRNHFAKENPVCAVCGKKPIQVHHQIPFSQDASLELEVSNLISLCPVHHLWFGHLGSYHSYNSNIEEDAALWYTKINNRP